MDVRHGEVRSSIWLCLQFIEVEASRNFLLHGYMFRHTIFSSNEQVRAKHGLHEGDMPEPRNLRAKLECLDFKEFPRLSLAAIRQFEEIVDVDIQAVSRVSALTNVDVDGGRGEGG